jgi:RNA polymerase sigma factor (sigma-70 family)
LSEAGHEGFPWADFIHTYRASAVRFAAGLSGDPSLADDLVQEAIRSAYERAIRGELVFQSLQHARNYVFRAIHNLAASAARSRALGAQIGLDAAAHASASEHGPLEELQDLEASAAALETERSIQLALDGLRPVEREALTLRFLTGLTYAEMSERTGRPISTLQERVESALKKIRRAAGKALREAKEE